MGRGIPVIERIYYYKEKLTYEEQCTIKSIVLCNHVTIKNKMPLLPETFE